MTYNFNQAIHELRQARGLLGNTINSLELLLSGGSMRKPSATVHTSTPASPHYRVRLVLPKTRTLSAAGRKRIAAAQKARWAKQRGMGVVPKKGKAAA